MEQKNEKRCDFINPYNFVPLGKKCSRGEYKKGKLSGVIEYSMLTKTPLFVPDTDPANIEIQKVKVDKEQKEHKAYKFFTYDGEKPVIPGSEMRGMLRNYYEILTNSCLSAVDTEATLSKRTNESFKAGLIKKSKGDRYELYSARDCLLRTVGENDLKVILKSKNEEKLDSKYLRIKSFKQENLKEGDKVYVSIIDRGPKAKALIEEISHEKKGKCRYEAYVLKGENGPDMGKNEKKKDTEKHCCHIFMRDIGNVKGYSNLPVASDIQINTLQKVIEVYQKQNDSKDSYKEYKEQLERYIKGESGNEYFPVYYSVIKDGNKTILLLSPASITREIAENKLNKMIGDYAPCKTKDCICPACRLFGMLNSSTTVTSRIRVSDMNIQEESQDGLYDTAWTLKPLSTPKLQNLEFYMKKPADNAWFWTYDYYIDNKGIIHINNKPEINGRKFYWHHKQVNKSIVTTEKKDDKNVTVTPVKEGNSFTGKIYFDDLTADELNSLIYLLNAGEKGKIDKTTRGYKLGHAKPFGFGSVALSVNSINIRITEMDNGSISRRCLNVTDKYEGVSELIDKENIKNFDTITNFDAIPESNISYPVVDSIDDDGFKWFTENHKSYSAKKQEYKNAPICRTEMLYYEYMEPMEPKLKLVDPNMDKTLRKSSGNNSRGEGNRSGMDRRNLGNKNHNNGNNNQNRRNNLRPSDNGGNNKNKW